jgi:hypothetical protein
MHVRTQQTTLHKIFLFVQVHEKIDTDTVVFMFLLVAQTIVDKSWLRVRLNCFEIMFSGTANSTSRMRTRLSNQAC